MSLASGTRLGPYEIQSAIGAGGMGEVYKARDIRLDRTVAIKVLPPDVSGDPERRARFEREAKTVAGLSHPHICPLFDVGDHDGALFLVMEDLAGQTLAERLEKGALPLEQALTIATEIADALSAAHRQGVIHRDLKPGNVMLTKAGAKLLDFGLAKLTGHGEQPAAVHTGSAVPTQAATLTGQGVIVGTLHYMAPEQLEGRPPDTRTDLWALGAIIYEVLTGTRAFEGASAVSVMSAIMEREPASISSLRPLTPAALDRFVRDCLEKDPEDRWQSARDVKRELERIRDLVTDDTRSPGEAGKRRPAGTTFLAVAGVLVASLATAAAVWWYIGQPAQPIWHRLTFRRGTIHSARFMPDGQNILYTAAWEGHPPESFTGRVDGVDSLPLPALQDGDPPFASDVAAISPRSDLALIRRRSPNTVVAVPGMLLTVPYGGGTPAPKRAEVTSADWASDGSQLAATVGVSTLEFPLGRVIYRATDWMVSDVRLSPGGELLAFRRHKNGHGWVVIVDSSGKQKTQSTWYQDVGAPSWTPDGREVWFTAHDEGSRHALRAMSVSGRQRTVMRQPVRFVLHDVARDGRLLLTVEDWRVATRGLAPGERVERDLSYYSWSIADDISDDGRFVLFDEGGESDKLGWRQWLRRTDGSRPPVEVGQGSAGKLSPDGKLVVAVTCCDEHANQNFQLITTDPVGQRRLDVHGLVPNARAMANTLRAWLPDSRAFLFDAHEPGRPD